MSAGECRPIRTAWLATQWGSNQSPIEFPANREFYREICDSEALEDVFSPETAARSHFSSNSLYELTGNTIRVTGNSQAPTGIFVCSFDSRGFYRSLRPRGGRRGAAKGCSQVAARRMTHHLVPTDR